MIFPRSSQNLAPGILFSVIVIKFRFIKEAAKLLRCLPVSQTNWEFTINFVTFLENLTFNWRISTKFFKTLFSIKVNLVFTLFTFSGRYCSETGFFFGFVQNLFGLWPYCVIVLTMQSYYSHRENLLLLCSVILIFLKKNGRILTKNPENQH